MPRSTETPEAVHFFACVDPKSPEGHLRSILWELLGGMGAESVENAAQRVVHERDVLRDVANIKCSHCGRTGCDGWTCEKLSTALAELSDAHERIKSLESHASAAATYVRKLDGTIAIVIDEVLPAYPTFHKRMLDVMQERSVFLAKKDAPNAPAREDYRTAKPMTELVAVMLADGSGISKDGTVHTNQASHYLARATWHFKTPHVERCAKHGTKPASDEPCWQCENGEEPSRLTESQLIAACKNIGFDLMCGGCASIFYTGMGLPHDTHTCSRKTPDVAMKATKAVVVEITRGPRRGQMGTLVREESAVHTVVVQFDEDEEPQRYSPDWVLIRGR